MATWAVTGALGVVLESKPAWLPAIYEIAHAAVAVALGWAATDRLRIWGATLGARLGVAATFALWLMTAVARFAANAPMPALAVVSGALLLALLGVYLWPGAAAARLPRCPEWEVLHRLSAITAKAEPLTQEEAIERAPEFHLMIEGARSFRTRETGEYLDVFAQIARADLRTGPEPEDRSVLDARWRLLHRELARKFGPQETWHVAPKR